jgi:hypothetical protein
MKRIAPVLACGLLISLQGWAAEPELRRPSLTKEQRAFVWDLLERNARTSAEAGFLLHTLYLEGHDDLLSQGWARFGSGELWLDWWLVLRPERSRDLFNDRPDMFFIQYCDESETKAVEERPKILERIVRAQLYLQGLDESGWRPRKEPMSFDEIKEIWLDWKDFAWMEHDRRAALINYDRCKSTNKLRRCYWLFGRGDEVRNVTNASWERDYLAFRKWITDNESYFRFDRNVCRYILDEAAKKARRLVPADTRAIPNPTTPFPDWNEMPPENDYRRKMKYRVGKASPLTEP